MQPIEEETDDVRRVLFSVSRVLDGSLQFHVDPELSAQGLLLLASTLRLAEQRLMIVAQRGCYSDTQEKE